QSSSSPEGINGYSKIMLRAMLSVPSNTQNLGNPSGCLSPVHPWAPSVLLGRPDGLGLGGESCGLWLGPPRAAGSQPGVPQGAGAQLGSA
uniref:Uncharacterized protein n=1 Tax=Zonotrichia albicollis TaxID=44394 RepID=A0A8D2MN59_ZONAL